MASHAPCRPGLSIQTGGFELATSRHVSPPWACSCVCRPYRSHRLSQWLTSYANDQYRLYTALDLTDEPVFMINAVDEAGMLYGRFMHKSVPPWYALSYTHNGLELTRTGPHSVEIFCTDGSLLDDHIVRFLRPSDKPLRAGHSVQLPAVVVTVLTTAGPWTVTRIRVEGPGLTRGQWLMHDEDGLRRTTLPAIGTTLHVPAPTRR